MNQQITPATLRPHLNEPAALDLLKRAVAIPSITGTESAFAAFLAQELRAQGAANVELRDFAPGRPNVWGTHWGTHVGAGGGRNLLLVATWRA